jgi:hypothetical protein
MKKISLSGILLFALVNSAYAQDGVVSIATANANFCLIAGTPSAEFKYSIVKTVKFAKGSYGGVKDVLPIFVEEAKIAGADAIIDYAGTQRFGFFPWRLVRPVLRGTAIKWEGTAPVDCEKAGGMTMSAVIAANKAPEKATDTAPEQAPAK